MVDLGQKRWKRFRLFYFLFLEKRKEQDYRIKMRLIDIQKKRRVPFGTRLFSLFFALFSYLSKAYLLATSVQLITLKKASI